MSNVFPSLRGVIGSWVYYPVLFTPKQVFELIKTSKEIRENSTLDDYLQRGLTTNVGKILEYINSDEDRFFNSIIVGVFGGVPDWLALNIAGVDDLSEDEKSLIDESIGILKFSGDEEMFAIDGQHRVEAIKKKYISDSSYNDQISVIFVAHSETVLGKKRTRRLFSDLNKKAQRVSPGELAIIDEQDIENIVARKVYAEYSRIPSNVISLSKSAPIKSTESVFFTNLLTIVKVCKILSTVKFKRKKSNYSIDDIDGLYKITCGFFDSILDTVELEASKFSPEKIRKLRLTDSNIVMRPLGLEILSDVYKKLILAGRIHVWQDYISKVDLRMTGPLFNNLVYINGKIVPKNKSYSIALMLFETGVIGKEELDLPDHVINKDILKIIS